MGPFSHLGQRAANVLLENHNHNQNERGDELVHQPIEGRQSQELVLAQKNSKIRAGYPRAFAPLAFP